jgi:hypothetical protein
MLGYRGGLASIGGFAPHPGAQCLPDRNVAVGGLVTLKPSALLWTPEASRAAAVPTLDPTDPWALRLLPQDVPSGFYLGQFVNLCDYLPALGRHRAYLLRFATGARGLALDIVTHGTAAARGAFRKVDRVVAQLPWVTKVQRVRELQATARIGDETRVFTIRVQDYACGDLDLAAGDFGDLNCTTVQYSASVVVWRHGSVIGMVVTNTGRSHAMELARKLLARSEHPSD